MNQNISNFLLCGSAGWCMEIFWTGLHSLFTGQKTLTGKTSLLMFPIYGCAAVIAPLSVKLSSFPFFYRGILYTAGFYLVEFISGSFLKQFGMCPWDYSGVPLQCHGLCATVVYCRTDFRKNSDRPSLIFYYEYGKIILKNQFY